MKKVKSVFLRKNPFLSKDNTENHMYPIDISGSKQTKHFVKQKNLASPNNEQPSRPLSSPSLFTATIFAKMKKHKKTNSKQNSNEIFADSSIKIASPADITLVRQPLDNHLSSSSTSSLPPPASTNEQNPQKSSVDVHFIILGRQFCITDCQAMTLYYLCAAIRDMVEPILNVKINPILLELTIPCAKNPYGIREILTNRLLQKYGGLSNVLAVSGVDKDLPINVEVLGDMRRCYACSEENWGHQMQCIGEIQITPQLPNFLVDLINVFTYRFENDKKIEIDVQELEQYEEIDEMEDLFPSVLDKLARRLGGNKIEVTNSKTGVITSFGAKFNAILKSLHQVTGSQPPEGCSPWVLEQKLDNATIIVMSKDTTSPPCIMQWLQYTIDLVCLLWDALPGLPALNIQGTITRRVQVPDDILTNSHVSSMLSAQNDHGTITITRRNIPILTSFQPGEMIPRIYSIQDLLLQGTSIEEIKFEENIVLQSQFRSHWVVELQSPKLHLLRLGNLYKHCDSCHHLLEHQSTSDIRALVTHRTAFSGQYGAVIKRHGTNDQDYTELTLNPLSNCIRDDDPYIALDKFSDDEFIVFGSIQTNAAPLASSGKSLKQQDADKRKERLCSGCQQWFSKPAETIILWTCAQNFYGGMIVIGHYCTYLCVPFEIRHNIQHGKVAWER